jgi:hypothetical protein
MRFNNTQKRLPLIRILLTVLVIATVIYLVTHYLIPRNTFGNSQPTNAVPVNTSEGIK